MNDLLQSVIAKIQKLMNLKEGAEAVGSIHEAENAAMRVQELLMRYNLDLETVQATSIQIKAEFFDGWIELGDKQGKSESFWVPKLYSAIANNNLCRAIFDNTSVRILGRKDQVELVLYIADQMISKVRIAEKYSWAEYTGEEKRGTFRRGFYSGAVIGINSRLRNENTKSDNPYAVMIVSRESELDLYEMWGTLDPEIIKRKEMAVAQRQRDFQEAYEKEQRMLATLSEKELKEWKKAHKGPKFKYSYSKGPRGLSSNDGYVNGKIAGEKMSINRGMGGSGNLGQLN